MPTSRKAGTTGFCAGGKLKDFKQLVDDSEGYSLSRTARLMLLTEPGVHAAAILSRKKAGRKGASAILSIE